MYTELRPPGTAPRCLVLTGNPHLYLGSGQKVHMILRPVLLILNRDQPELGARHSGGPLVVPGRVGWCVQPLLQAPAKVYGKLQLERAR